MMTSLPSRPPLLEVREAVLRFGGVVALDGASLAVHPGEVMGLIGPNGAGKTTLLNVMAGLLRPQHGQVVLDGQDVTRLGPSGRARRGLVRSFQIARELGRLTVLENLLLAAPAQRGEAVLGALLLPRAVAAEERASAERALGILTRIGLRSKADDLAAGLSGGQKKLLELGRALMLRPRVVLLDEPAAGVAPPLVQELARLVRELAAEGIGFALVEHDMALVQQVCDRVQVLAEGRPLAAGSFAEVTSDRRVVDAYLGGMAA